jgi:hypothetical protein
MGTRSFIAIKQDDNFTGIYCHWDGYIDHNGRILHEYYQDKAKVLKLIALGDISVLNGNIGEKVDFDNPPRSDSGGQIQVIAYGRDRGETGIEAQTVNSVEALLDKADKCGAEYVYIYDEKRNADKWVVGSRGMCCFGMGNGEEFSKFLPLSEEIEKLKEEDAA